MDWSEGEWDSIMDCLFSLSMLAKLVSSHCWMDHLLEMQKLLSPLGSLHSCLVLCPFISDHACPGHWVDLPMVSVWHLRSHTWPIGCDVVWLWLASPVKAWSLLSDPFGPERILQTLSLSVLCQFIIGHTIPFPFSNFVDTYPLWAKKVPWNVTTICESLTNFSSYLQGVFPTAYLIVQTWHHLYSL